MKLATAIAARWSARIQRSRKLLTRHAAVAAATGATPSAPERKIPVRESTSSRAIIFDFCCECKRSERARPCRCERIQVASRRLTVRASQVSPARPAHRKSRPHGPRPRASHVAGSRPAHRKSRAHGPRRHRKSCPHGPRIASRRLTASASQVAGCAATTTTPPPLRSQHGSAPLLHSPHGSCQESRADWSI